MQGMLFVFHRRNNHRFCRGAQGFHVFNQVKPRAVTQVQIHQHHIKIILTDQPTSFADTAALPQQVDPQIGQQLVCDNAAHVGVVINQQDPDRLFCLADKKFRPHRG